MIQSDKTEPTEVSRPGNSLMSAATLAEAWKRHIAGTAPAVRPAAPTAAVAGGFTYTLARATDYERPPCVLKGDATQPCNPEGGTYLATRNDGRVQRLCCNHACRLAHAKGLRWPVVAV